jgi:hypothetical protein
MLDSLGPSGAGPGPDHAAGQARQSLDFRGDIDAMSDSAMEQAQVAWRVASSVKPPGAEDLAVDLLGTL